MLGDLPASKLGRSLGGLAIDAIELYDQAGQFLGIGWIYGTDKDIREIQKLRKPIILTYGDRIENRMDPMPADLFLERHD